MSSAPVRGAGRRYRVNDLGKAEDPEKWSEEKTRNETDIIRSRVKKTIEQELADDPYAQLVFSELLKQAIAEAEAQFDHPYKQYMLFKDFEEKVRQRDVEGIPAALNGNKHAKAYFGTFRLVLGDDALSARTESRRVIDDALFIDETVQDRGRRTFAQSAEHRSRRSARRCCPICSSGSAWTVQRRSLSRSSRSRASAYRAGSCADGQGAASPMAMSALSTRSVSRRTGRRKIAIHVHPDASVQVDAPEGESALRDPQRRAQARALDQAHVDAGARAARICPAAQLCQRRRSLLSRAPLSAQGVSMRTARARQVKLLRGRICVESDERDPDAVKKQLYRLV